MPREVVTCEGPTHVHVGYPKGGMIPNQTAGVQVGVVGDESDGGLWAHLNRQAINDLIRHLRRARDAAFGADQ